MIKKTKKILSVMLTLATVMTIGSPTVQAAETVQPRGMYIRECVAYEPNYTSINYTHKYLGSVSGDNRDGSSALSITYVYEQSGTTTASISTYANGSVEAGVVFAKMAAEAGIEVTGSRSWTKGTSGGATYSIAPGKFEILGVYIPAVKTAGRLKYKVYMDSNPTNISYEYVTLSESYAPKKNSVHYKVSATSKSTLNVPTGITVYTPEGMYKAQ